jgi:predicted AlkP superfamily phosphohydrolase/phosphomutase
MQRLMDEGSWGVLRSVIPPITGPSWTSFITGKNPGQHGIFDFTRRQPDSYQTGPCNASHRHGESVWSILSRAEKRVCALNVPATYPVEPVNGVLVSGMGTPASTQAYCYPVTLQDELLGAVPEYEVQPSGIFEPRGRELEMLHAVREMTDMRLRAALHLLKRDEWDFFMVVFMAADLVQHYFWHYMDPQHKRYDPDAAQELQTAIRDCYRQLDNCLAEILACRDEDTLLLLMSDHGFGPQHSHLHTNVWLWENGYLRFKRHHVAGLKELAFRMGFTPANVYEALYGLRTSARVEKGIQKNRNALRSLVDRVFLSFHDVDWTRTRAYSVGNLGPIYFNLEGREPEGIVPPGPEYEALQDELIAALTASCDPASGAPVIGQVYRRQEIYSGSRMDNAPDLLYFARDERQMGYGLFKFPTNQWISPSDRCGNHRMEGILLMHGPGIRAGHQLPQSEIIDLAPTILAAQGVPVPSDMDGRVLSAAFSAGEHAIGSPLYQAPGPEPEPAEVDLSKEEEEEIMARLRGLGYVG